MSEEIKTGEQSQQQNTSKNENDVCRDFLNGICNRGEKCRFYHPQSEDGKTTTADNYNFCIDFQASFINKIGIT